MAPFSSPHQSQRVSIGHGSCLAPQFTPAVSACLASPWQINVPGTLLPQAACWPSLSLWAMFSGLHWLLPTLHDSVKVSPLREVFSNHLIESSLLIFLHPSPPQCFFCSTVYHSRDTNFLKWLCFLLECKSRRTEISYYTQSHNFGIYYPDQVSGKNIGNEQIII